MGERYLETYHRETENDGTIATYDEFYVDDDICTNRAITERLRQTEYDTVYLDDGLEHEVRCDRVDETSMSFEILKMTDEAHQEKGLVSGWASIAKNADGTIPFDWQGDIIDPADLEDAAVNFMLDYRESGEMHEGDSVGDVVESIVFTKDKQAAMGIPPNTVPEGWFITVKLNDMDVFEKVKTGELRMFSIQGVAERVDL